MHELRLLHTWLEKACPFMHRARAGALGKVVGGLLDGGKLALTHIGRHLRSAAFAKHNIKCVDRLLGNAHLHRERREVYRAMAQWLLASTPRPVLLVDWSGIEDGREFAMLKAAVPVGGRALSVYEEAHPIARYNSAKVHRRFLAHLAEVLPEGCVPIVVTDAGFRGPWFLEVEALGWDWIGRVRGQVNYKLDETTIWRTAASLFPGAASTPRHLGAAQLSKEHAQPCHLYLVRKTLRGPGRPRKRRRQGDRARCRAAALEPWLLATSLPHRRGSARQVTKWYSLRMQIEETFRDLKGGRWGFGLAYARTRRTKRLEILLLIGALSMLLCWLVGLAGKARGWMRHFQANTERREPVLSVFFLGRQLLRSHRFKPTRAEMKTTSQELPLIVAQCSATA